MRSNALLKAQLAVEQKQQREKEVESTRGLQGRRGEATSLTHVDLRLVGTRLLWRLTLRHVRSGHCSASLVASTSASAVALKVRRGWLMRMASPSRWGWLSRENLPSFRSLTTMSASVRRNGTKSSIFDLGV